jgi:tetratricopeptide (TPR) repeat protein
MGGNEGDRLGASSQPHELYLMAKRAWMLRSPEALRQCLELARCAVSRDPSFALGYAAIGLAEVSLACLPCDRPRDGMERARTAAQLALSLAPENADAHATLGAVAILFDWDALAARASFDHAIEIDPGCATAWLWYSIVHMAGGDFAEGIRCVDRARALEPEAAIHNVLAAWLLGLSGQPEQALRTFHERISTRPGAMTRSGDWIKRFRRCRRVSP